MFFLHSSFKNNIFILKNWVITFIVFKDNILSFILFFYFETLKSFYKVLKTYMQKCIFLDQMIFFSTKTCLNVKTTDATYFVSSNNKLFLKYTFFKHISFTQICSKAILFRNSKIEMRVTVFYYVYKDENILKMIGVENYAKKCPRLIKHIFIHASVYSNINKKSTKTIKNADRHIKD